MDGRVRNASRMPLLLGVWEEPLIQSISTEDNFVRERRFFMYGGASWLVREMCCIIFAISELSGWGCLIVMVLTLGRKASIKGFTVAVLWLGGTAPLAPMSLWDQAILSPSVM